MVMSYLFPQYNLSINPKKAEKVLAHSSEYQFFAGASLLAFCVEGSIFGSWIKSLTLILLLSLFSLFSVEKKHNKTQSTLYVFISTNNNAYKCKKSRFKKVSL